jgi:hypothetical protein
VCGLNEIVVHPAFYSPLDVLLSDWLNEAMNFKFPIRGPDYVAEEIATVLSTKATMEFKDIFDIVFANLRSKELSRSGEEMLRLRCYEKLQGLVSSGFVTRDAKKYKGVPKMLKEFFKMAADHNARVAAGVAFQPGVKPKVSGVVMLKSDSKAVIAKTPIRKAKAGLVRADML